jgi:hypothetical protein
MLVKAESSHFPSAQPSGLLQGSHSPYHSAQEERALYGEAKEDYSEVCRESP